jgi:hypothetical protein
MKTIEQQMRKINYNISIIHSNLTDKLFYDCAKIHIKEIKYGFLTSLGKSFLFILYKFIYKSKNSFLIIAKKNYTTVGFIAGCYDMKKFYFEFFVKKFYIMFFIIKNLLTVKKVINIKNFSTSDNNYSKSLILNFCVLKKYQNVGIGKKLFKQSNKFFIKKNIKLIKIITGKNQLNAQKFYLSIGAIKKSVYNIHLNNSSIFFLYKINKNFS